MHGAHSYNLPHPITSARENNMKASEVKPGRYIAKVNNQRTIVTVSVNRITGGWSYRDERTNRYCRCSPRRLWRPVAGDWERWDSDTVQNYGCAEHGEMMHAGRVWLPVIEDDWCDESITDVTQTELSITNPVVAIDWHAADVSAEMYRLRNQAGRERLVALAGC